MTRHQNPVLAPIALALLGAASAPAVLAAPNNPAAISRALTHIQRFPAQSADGPDSLYTATDVTVDTDGTEHVRVDRRYRGLRVIGGDMVVHSGANGVLRDVSKSLDRPLNVDTKPLFSASAVTSAALADRAGYSATGTPELVVNARTSTPELAYEVQLSGQKPDGTPSVLHVLVSGLSGRVMESWDEVETAASAGTGNGFFSGVVPLSTDSGTATVTVGGVKTTVNGFYLRDVSRGSQYTVNMANKTSGGSTFFTQSTANSWGNGALTNVESVGVDAQYGTAMTWDYYKTVHGRNGIANDGKGAYNRVHYSSKYNNAFWTDSCFCMTYGDGDGVNFNPFDSLDVAGHEMSHGVTSRTAKLVYSGESGGLNEATSDIFGTAVEFYAANPKDTPDYLIGERLYKTSGKFIRTMIQPSLDGVSADCWYSTLGSLDVHYSSGVANHFFYLLAQGTTAGVPSKTCVMGNTRVGSGTATLTGIGQAKAEKIWYRALTVYMTSSTNYAAARVATLNAAKDLYGSGSAEYNAVAAAWSALLVN